MMDAHERTGFVAVGDVKLNGDWPVNDPMLHEPSSSGAHGDPRGGYFSIRRASEITRSVQYPVMQIMNVTIAFNVITMALYLLQ